MTDFAVVESLWRGPESLRFQPAPALRCGGVPPSSNRPGGPFHEKHFLHLVDLLEFHFDDFGVGSLHGAPDEARFNRQLAVAAIDKDQKLHAGRATVVEQS